MLFGAYDSYPTTITRVTVRQQPYAVIFALLKARYKSLNFQPFLQEWRIPGMDKIFVLLNHTYFSVFKSKFTSFNFGIRLIYGDVRLIYGDLRFIKTHPVTLYCRVPCKNHI